MARDYKGTGKKAEKQGEGLGGGPVGSSGGYSGRPGGSQPSQNRPSSAPRPGGPQNPGGPNRPDNGERASAGPDRSGGSGMLLAGLAYLLLGKKSNGQRSSGLGSILRIVVILFIVVLLIIVLIF